MTTVRNEFYSFHTLDIDECGINNGGCNQTCVNEIASYYCQCKIGYTLNLDGHDCDGMLIVL